MEVFVTMVDVERRFSAKSDLFSVTRGKFPQMYVKNYRFFLIPQKTISTTM